MGVGGTSQAPPTPSPSATAAGRPTAWVPTGWPPTIGSLDPLGNGSPTTKNYLNGQISDIQTFNYAVSAPQVSAILHQIN
jgi:hypothetical protein